MILAGHYGPFASNRKEKIILAGHYRPLALHTGKDLVTQDNWTTKAIPMT